MKSIRRTLSFEARFGELEVSSRQREHVVDELRKVLDLSDHNIKYL